MSSPNSAFLTFEGSSALTEFQSERLASRIGHGVTAVSSWWMHYVYLAPGAALTPDEQRNLQDILSYGDPVRRTSVKAGATRSVAYVCPRPGTISPWSTQATGISHVCGFGRTVNRIERGQVLEFYSTAEELPDAAFQSQDVYDRMTQVLSRTPPSLEAMFAQPPPGLLQTIPVLASDGDAYEAIRAANKKLGLGLSPAHIDHLVAGYQKLGRDPTDVELMSYSQVNSEHCRHITFSSSFEIDGQLRQSTLFELIKTTHAKSPQSTISAYSDNCAVFEGHAASHYAPNRNGEWAHTPEDVHFTLKAETHNHPTAISPFPGAATGSGGEIRDEGSVGVGSTPQSGFSGFTTSDLLHPDHLQPWELDCGKPYHTASALEIMIEGPLGSAQYNNEFGRPNTAGYFRTLTLQLPDGNEGTEIRGYHKPVMLAGGVGRVRPQLALKDPEAVPPGCHAIVIGGPAMLIGLGGGAASSAASTDASVELDFASVQRGQAEVQRRCHEVIQASNAMGANSPIKFIHDVGAGGLCNAFPELVNDAKLGGAFQLRAVDSADQSLSPLQIWCCEAQERYVLAVAPEDLNRFKQIAERERCGYSVVGKTTAEKRLLLLDADSSGQHPIDLPIDFLFSQPPKTKKVFFSRKLTLPRFDSSLASYTPARDVIKEAAYRLLKLPAVGSKSFLITIGDRTVGGLTARDQMVGPYQVPVADCSVSATSLGSGHHGAAMALGERPTLALISPAASAKMAIAESLLNLAASDVKDRLSRVRLSCNWMAARDAPGEGAALYQAVEAICTELCPQLGISIPVGKDSLSMATSWQDQQSREKKQVVSPLTLVATAFAPVRDFRRTWTPTIRRLKEATCLVYVDLALGYKALGGSCLAQCFQQVGDSGPDVRKIGLLKDFFDATEQLHDSGIVLAYHDISDGGLFTTLAEMLFAGRCGLKVFLDEVSKSSRTEDLIEALFCEELGAIFQIRDSDFQEFHRCFATCGPPAGLIKRIGQINLLHEDLTIAYEGKKVFVESRVPLQEAWASTSYHMQRIRDNPECADMEFATINDSDDPGISYRLSFDPREQLKPKVLSGLMSSLSLTAKPRVAILREEGTNCASETAYAFETAGFVPVDVHMTDILAGRFSLASVRALAACGGFSYSDVLGAGRGWAQAILRSPRARTEFQQFFARPDTLAIGICNGAQLFTHLVAIIPDADGWPVFMENRSRRFEGRFTMVRIAAAAAPPWLHGMHGSMLPIVSSHGEGRAAFPDAAAAARLLAAGRVALQYVDNGRVGASAREPQATEAYPANPNGSPLGITGVAAAGGRVLAIMPHPERTILGGVASYIPPGKAEAWGSLGPWARLFASARRWLG